MNFLREFMDLPLSYLAPGAAMKFRKLISLISFVIIIALVSNHYECFTCA